MRPMTIGIPLGLMEAHVYLISLSLLESPGLGLAARALLTGPETECHGRIKAPRRRAEYLLGRYALKKILAAYLGVPARAVLIEPDKWGKPRLAGNPAGPKLGFNLSHSAQTLALAVCREGEIGIDIEAVDDRMLPDITAIAGRHFSPAEQGFLLGRSPQDRLEHFFRMWTLKEAVLKAVGTGLHAPLASAEVAAPHRRYRIEWRAETGTASLEARHWDGLIAGHHIALARTGLLETVRLFGLGLDAAQTGDGTDRPVLLDQWPG